MPLQIYLYKPTVEIGDQVLAEIDDQVPGGVQAYLVEAGHLRVCIPEDIKIGSLELVEITNVNPLQVKWIPLPTDQRFDREVQFLRCKTLYLLSERQCHLREISFQEFLRDFYYPVCQKYGDIESGLRHYLENDPTEFSPYGVWMKTFYKRYLRNA